MREVAVKMKLKLDNQSKNTLKIRDVLSLF